MSSKERCLEKAYELRAAGLCIRCKDRRDGDYKWHCNRCALWMREYMRARTNSKPQAESGKGRKCIIEDDGQPTFMAVLKCGQKHRHSMAPGPFTKENNLWFCGLGKCDRVEKRRA